MSSPNAGINIEIVALVPRNELDVDFDQLDAIPSGPEVNIIDDYELQKAGLPVVDIAADSKLTFYTNCTLPQLVIQFWNSNRFMSLSIILVDDKRQKRTFHISNKRSIITVDKNVCSIPIEITEGWQRVNLDFESLLQNAFGTSFMSCYEIQVCGALKLARLFFQGKDYADNELPSYLRVHRPQQEV